MRLARLLAFSPLRGSRTRTQPGRCALLLALVGVLLTSPLAGAGAAARAVVTPSLFGAGALDVGALPAETSARAAVASLAVTQSANFRALRLDQLDHAPGTLAPSSLRSPLPGGGARHGRAATPRRPSISLGVLIPYRSTAPPIR